MDISRYRKGVIAVVAAVVTVAAAFDITFAADFSEQAVAVFDSLAAILLILAQCKSGGKYAFAGFGPASRERLALEAAQAGGRAVLVFKGTRQRGYDVIGMEDWPDAS